MKTMKKQINLFITIVCACAAMAVAQERQQVIRQAVVRTSQAPNDTIAMSLKMKALLNKQITLQNKIKEEDGKRNAVYNGVSAETQEMLNDRQDSICLDLRSQLVDVQLEIVEQKRGNLMRTITQIKLED